MSLLTELAIIAVMRTRKRFYESRPSTLLVSSALLVGAAGLILPYSPVAGVLGFAALDASIVVSILVVVVLYALASEQLKPQIGQLARQTRRQRRARPRQQFPAMR